MVYGGSNDRPLHARRSRGSDVELGGGSDRTVGRDDGRIDRLVVLHARLSGYVAACLRALKDRCGVRLLVMRYPSSESAPYEEEQFSWIDRLLNGKRLSADEIAGKTLEFEPDLVLMAGWFASDYLRAARTIRKRGIPVVATSDKQWRGTVRQQIARLVAPWYLRSAIDVLWVPGERQREFARRLGYRGSRCWEGCLSCDWEAFASGRRPDEDRSRQFVYVGRYVERKGLDTLVEAYRRYRRQSSDPWRLVCAGAGEMADRLEDVTGVDDRGFVQPGRLPDLMGGSRAFVLPSRHEPWGVVLHEAATAGLPIISSTASGASVHLVSDGYNGFIVDPGAVAQLVRSMQRMADLPPSRRRRMAERSHELSSLYTPERWAETLSEGFRELTAGR